MNQSNLFGTFFVGLLNPATWQGAIVLAVVVFTAAWGLTRLIRAVGERIRRDNSRMTVDKTSVTFLQQFAQVVVYVIAFAIFAQAVPQLRSLGTALLAGVSIASVVIGLAAQSTLSNFIAGISLLLYRPFKVTDRIQVNAPTGVETGVVEAVTLGYTVLRTLDRRRVVVPNSLIANQVTVNLTHTSKRVLITVPFTVPAASFETARSLLTELAARHPHCESVLDCPVMSVSFDTVRLGLRVWCREAVLTATLEWQLIEQASSALEQAEVRLLAAGNG